MPNIEYILHTGSASPGNVVERTIRRGLQAFSGVSARTPRTFPWNPMGLGCRVWFRVYGIRLALGMISNFSLASLSGITSSQQQAHADLHPGAPCGKHIAGTKPSPKLASSGHGCHQAFPRSCTSKSQPLGHLRGIISTVISTMNLQAVTHRKRGSSRAASSTHPPSSI